MRTNLSVRSWCAFKHAHLRMLEESGAHWTSMSDGADINIPDESGHDIRAEADVRSSPRLLVSCAAIIYTSGTARAT